MAKLSGGELIAKMLKKEGVEKVFGIIDGTYLALNAACRKHGIELITPRHETSAAHMAGAYARATGKLGVCIASNGPGAANVLPGVAVENGEGNRVLLITSFRRTGIVHPDRGGTYQYFNQSAVIRPMSKWSVAVPSFDRVQELMQRAFRNSFKGRPGVVHIDVPEDIMNSKAEWAGKLLNPSAYRLTEPAHPSADQVARAADMLIKAELPMIHAGSGVIHAGAFDELQKVAELLQAPVTTSWAARGAMVETSPYSVPMVHIKLNNKVRNMADVVLTLGSRLGETDWWGKAPYWRHHSEQKMIQVDIDEDILGCNKPADMQILSDVKVFLTLLAEELENKKNKIPITARRRKINSLERQKNREREKLNDALSNKKSPVFSAQVPYICQKVFDDDALAVFDGGNTAVWGNFYHDVKVPNAAFSTFKFGMLGAGVSQALGVKAAHPDRQVYCIIGDGAMGFHPQEIETAVRNNLPVVFLVLADKQWGMVKMTQQIALKPLKTMIKKSLDADETINADFNEIEWDKLAHSCGAHGERVSKFADLKPAIERAIESGNCAVIHVDVDPVKHMWAPGLLHFKAMHQEPAGK